jgi:predicted O-methyltransferase YrrM
MIREAELFTDTDRYLIHRHIIDDISVPVGDHYGNEVFDNYFDVYAGVAKRYKPKRILEIGVRYGYTAICMMLGLHANRGAPGCEYLGLDDESYHPCIPKANENFAAVVPWAKAKAVHWNSFTGLPHECGTFQLIHVDGNHSYGGVINDLTHTWPVLDVGGLILLDDSKPRNDDGSPAEIYRAIQDFLLQFNCTGNMVEHQYVETLRGHYLIRKVD